MKSWVDGRPGRLVDLRDRGLNYGDGVFETMRVRRGAIRLLDFHLERLDEACRRLGLRAPKGAALRRELVRIAARESEAVLKLVLTRGVGARGYRPTGDERGTRIVSSHALPREPAPAAARARVCAMRLGANATLAGLKTLNRLESVLARCEWKDEGIWEGLMRDHEDNIVCGTMSNFFVRRGSSLVTPMLDRCGVAGVMRRWVLAQAPRAGLHARVGRVRWSDVESADEAFVTNAVAGIVPLMVIRHGRLRVRFEDMAAARALRQLLENE